MGKDIVFIPSSQKDLQKLPIEVQEVFLHGLLLASEGDKHPDAKPLTGFHGAGVLEIRDNFKKDTYRAVYTTKLKTVIYVLHVFKKKSTIGISTPKNDISLIKKRLKRAKEEYKKLGE